MINGEDLKQVKGRLDMLGNFSTEDILVFSKEDTHKVPEINLPDHILSYDHSTWTGYVRSTDDRKHDEFASKLRDICRG